MDQGRIEFAKRNDADEPVVVAITHHCGNHPRQRELRVETLDTTSETPAGDG